MPHEFIKPEDSEVFTVFEVPIATFHLNSEPYGTEEHVKNRNLYLCQYKTKPGKFWFPALG